MPSIDVAPSAALLRQGSRDLLGAAVHRHRPLSRAGLQERVFTLAFSRLVYAQIWEDPAVDIEALALEPGHHVVAIASGGCNLLSYLTAAPVRITALDLNATHVALNRLKLAAVQHLPGYREFYRMFGAANSAENVRDYDLYLSDKLDSASRAYWESRDVRGRRRIEAFARGFYRTGVLGRFISAGHLLARALGGDPSALMRATTLEEQRRIYERELKPLFQRRLVRKLMGQRSSLFGLGIPPAQYEALAADRPMHEVLEERLSRLACDFHMQDNYFAWQAFNRGYAEHGRGPLPPYLEEQSFERLRANAGSVTVENGSVTRALSEMPAESVDRVVLLDAQDWMGPADLTALWTEITRTARPGARVIFRTAGEETILPGRIPDALLRAWEYREYESSALTLRDRSAIYGGFHLYCRAA